MHKHTFISYIELGDTMKIFSIRNNRYNNYNFVSKAYHDKKIEGILLDIVMTRDNQIIIFPEETNTELGLKDIQKQTLKEIKNSEIEPLENYLSLLTDFNKRIILNIIPLNQPIITDYNAEIIFQQNLFYVTQILNIVKQYPKHNINLMSTNLNLLTILQKEAKNYPLAWYILTDNTNYIDLNIYIFNSAMLNDAILAQQLDNQKEIMVYVLNSNCINNVFNFFKDKDKNPIKKRIFDEISVITHYPDIFVNSYYP